MYLEENNAGKDIFITDLNGHWWYTIATRIHS